MGLTEAAAKHFYALRDKLYQLQLGQQQQRGIPLGAGDGEHQLHSIGDLSTRAENIRALLDEKLQEEGGEGGRLRCLSEPQPWFEAKTGQPPRSLHEKAEKFCKRLELILEAKRLLMGAKEVAAELEQALQAVQEGRRDLLEEEITQLKDSCIHWKGSMTTPLQSMSVKEGAEDVINDEVLARQFREATSLLKDRVDLYNILDAAVKVQQLEKGISGEKVDDWAKGENLAAECSLLAQQLAAITDTQVDASLRQHASDIRARLDKATHEYDMRRGILPARVTTGPYGGYGGGAWALDDPPVGVLTGIRLFSGDCLDGLELRFSQNGGGGQWTRRLGGRGGGPNPDLLLEPGEEIIEASVFIGHSRVYSLKFTTSSGRTVTLGNTTAHAEWRDATPMPPAAYHLAKFSGRSGLWMDQISLVWDLRKSITTGPFGGSGGNPWSEDAPGGGAPLTGLRAYFFDEFDAIQVKYGGDWGAIRGGVGGNKTAELELAADEDIISVDVVTGWVNNISAVLQLKVATSAPREMVLGPADADKKAGAQSHSATPQGPRGAFRLKALHGRAGYVLDQLAFVWEARRGLNKQRQ